MGTKKFAGVDDVVVRMLRQHFCRHTARTFMRILTHISFHDPELIQAVHAECVCRTYPEGEQYMHTMTVRKGTGGEYSEVLPELIRQVNSLEEARVLYGLMCDTPPHRRYREEVCRRWGLMLTHISNRVPHEERAALTLNFSVETRAA